MSLVTRRMLMDGPGGPSMSSYELPSSNEDQMEFRYKHWCGRAERGRTRAPPCRRYSGGTASYSAQLIGMLEQLIGMHPHAPCD